MATIIKLDGFAWVDRSGALAPVQARMDDLHAQQQLLLSRGHLGVPSPWPGSLRIAQDEDSPVSDDMSNGGSRMPNAYAVREEAPDLLGQFRLNTGDALDFLPTASVGGAPGDAHMLDRAFVQSNLPFDFVPP